MTSSHRVKGQITIFMFLGIAVIFIIGFGLTINRMLTEQKLKGEDDRLKKESQENRYIQEQVHACLYNIFQEGMVKVMEQGGYLDPGCFAPYGDCDNMTYITNTSSKVPVLIQGTTGKLPPNISTRICHYILVEAPRCTNILLEATSPNVNYPNANFNLSAIPLNYTRTRIGCETVLANKTVSVSLTYPIVIRNAMGGSELSQFRLELNNELGFFSKHIAPRLIGEAIITYPNPFNISGKCALINGILPGTTISAEGQYIAIRHGTDRFIFAKNNSNNVTGQCEAN